MKKLLIFIPFALVLTGCMTPIGKEEFTCENVKKGGVCGGAREIYELTNTRENLNEYADAIRAEKEGGKNSKQTNAPVVKNTPNKAVDNNVVYEPREHAQQTSSGYQPARVLPQQDYDNASRDGFDAFPGNGEPLAPEPLAIINPAKVMRILVASYTDDQGRLNMPGYVYVQVKEQSFSVGEAANLRPTRVVPLEVINRTQEDAKKQQQRTQGVSPLEVITGKK